MSSLDERQTDGWLLDPSRPEAESELQRRHVLSALLASARDQSPPSPQISAARSRANALLLHMSLFCGFPIFLVAFWRRDDPFVLHHAKAAGVGFLLFYSMLLLGLFVEPTLFWGALLCYLPSLGGIWRAAGGERAGLLSLGPVGEALFFPFQSDMARLRREHPERLLSDEQLLP